MAKPLEVKTYPKLPDGGMRMAVDIPQVFSEAVAAAIVGEISHLVAERYVAEHYAEIVAKLDQGAIANTLLAEAAERVREQMEKGVAHHVRGEIRHRFW